MKVNGKTITGQKIIELVLPLGNEDFIVFKFRPLNKEDNFEKVMPRPKPPVRLEAGGKKFNNIEDKNYVASVTDWASKQLAWQFLQSISVTDDLSWESVKMDDPNTWHKWEDELNLHFNSGEVNKIWQCFLDVNTLSEERMEEARKRFLASQEAQANV